MSKLTINGTLQLINQVNKRLSDLKNIRAHSISKSRTTYGSGADQRIEETFFQYDPKVLDQKITLLENWLFKANTAIKQANSSVVVDLEVDVDTLLEPLK
jgi:hypothetical protein